MPAPVAGSLRRYVHCPNLDHHNAASLLYP
jgi:hypothetical protein